ncbi:hypothetical protein [Campylobacter vicugnae]|uniref:hypothetical protein n=1 Tax=Campylobacter vicugnae TaxID=1660076 RepID=UPI000A352588|nr:hypothetical protein [Campylobacter sp. RM8835]
MRPKSYDISRGEINGQIIGGKIRRGGVSLPPILEDKSSTFWGYEGELFVLKNSGVLCIALEDIAEVDKDSVENLRNLGKIMYLSSFIGEGE